MVHAAFSTMFEARVLIKANSCRCVRYSRTVSLDYLAALVRFFYPKLSIDNLRDSKNGSTVLIFYQINEKKWWEINFFFFAVVDGFLGDRLQSVYLI